MFKSYPLIACMAAVMAVAAFAEDNGNDWRRSDIHHVLLISIDGMHAVDFLNCTNGISGANDGNPYCPNLANLATTGVNYVGATTSKPSDSFPGLMTIVSGATPRTMGVYYDVAYDRLLSAPVTTTGNGNAAGTCKTGKITGYTTEYDEGIDRDQTKLNGGAKGAGMTDGGIASIDPDKLDRDPTNGCAPVYPWNFVRTNTIFGVIHAAGGYTAWTDKHPSYSSVAGPGGTSLDDYYSPEINSTVVGLPGVSTASGTDCSTIPDAGADLTAWTNSFKNIQCYDTLKVNAILNQIGGKTHLGGAARTPTIYGMNFQAVSVGQKLIESGTKGGYLDAAGTPTPTLLNEIEFVDDAIGQMVNKIKDRGQYESTLIIITAKHGQSPIDPNLYDAIPGKTNNGSSPATILATAGYIPMSESPLNSSGIGSTEDDVSLLWLNSTKDTVPAVQLLEEKANRAAAGIGQIYYGPSVALNYNEGGLPPAGDTRTPDIIVTPNVGATYTGSAAKQMEHGGFAHDDTNVMLLVSNPALRPHTVSVGVGTLQVAPTILRALGLDPRALDGVRLEGTSVLPDINLNFGR